MFTMGTFWKYTLVETVWWGPNMAGTVPRLLGFTEFRLSMRVTYSKIKDVCLEELFIW